MEFDREEDDRWIAEVPSLPGVMAYGAARNDAENRALALTLGVDADRHENGEYLPLMPTFNVLRYESVAVS